MGDKKMGMRREEIRIQTIAQLERISGMLGSMGEEKDWTEYAIRALEQESVIEKIRAEIAQLTIVEGGDDYVRKMAELFSLKMKVLQIIDKYKAETEDV